MSMSQNDVKRALHGDHEAVQMVMERLEALRDNHI